MVDLTIADKMGISVATVKKHITKALGVMREKFKDHKADLLTICIFLYLQG